MHMSGRRAARGLAAAGIALAAVGAGAGCGSGKDYANNDRPPSPINLTAAISSRSVSVSPKHFGAGPIVLIVTNQSSASQRLTLATDETGGKEPGVSQSTGPINPQDTASLTVTLRPGSYVIKVADGGIRPAHLRVGSERDTAQNELLQP
jgi:hypothetical protein